MNLCRGCNLDFSSLSAFDRHRVGVHVYTYLEGLDMDPPCEDGRRCLDLEEMVRKGMEVDSRGRWRIRVSEQDRQRRQEWLKTLPGTPQESPDGGKR